MFGSFFNVCIYRFPRGLSIVKPGSHCYRCGQAIYWYDNIPIFSYWILRGRCRRCGAPFSARYSMVETLTAVLFLVAAVKIGYSLALVPAWILTGLLIIATFTDLDHWIIPDRISVGGLAAGLVLAAIWPIGLAAGNPLADSVLDVGGRWSPLVNAVAGAAVGFGFLWAVGAIGSLVFRKEAMGFGDVKLFAMFGAFCGLKSLLAILILASAIGSLVGLGGILLKRFWRGAPVDPALAPLEAGTELIQSVSSERPMADEERVAVMAALTHPGAVGPVRHHLPFGPSLAVAAWIVYMYGQAIERWFVLWVLGGLP